MKLDNTAVIDRGTVDGLLNLFDDRREGLTFLGELLRTYVQAGEETLADMRAAQAADDKLLLSRLAHKLKGLGRNIGALRLSQVCQELESHAERLDAARAATLCAAAGEEFAASCSELRMLQGVSCTG